MKISVYVPNELAEELDGKNLPVSSICQDALRRAVKVDQPCASDGCKARNATKFLVVRDKGYNVVVCENHLKDFTGDWAEVFAL